MQSKILSRRDVEFTLYEWLDVEADSDFYHGKWQACRYFFLWELPKVGP